MQVNNNDIYKVIKRLNIIFILLVKRLNVTKRQFHEFFSNALTKQFIIRCKNRFHKLRYIDFKLLTTGLKLKV